MRSTSPNLPKQETDAQLIRPSHLVYATLNYRPMSVLQTPGKILEKIFHRHINHHLGKYDILSKWQGGFRKYHSTVKTIAKLTDDIFENMNNKLLTVAGFIDFSKAFDTVDDSILIRKLDLTGVRGNSLE